MVYYGVSGMVISLVLIATYFIYGESWGISSIFLLIFFLFYVFCCAVSTMCCGICALFLKCNPTWVRGLATSHCLVCFMDRYILDWTVNPLSQACYTDLS